ncbi:MAG: FAD-dependent oxidoreductase [Pseudomonadota bacterium]
MTRATDSKTNNRRYHHAMQPLTFGGTTVRNRIFVPAHTTNFGADNKPSARHVAYHRARAEGGVGLIIFEGIRVHRSSLGRAQGVNGYERDAIPHFTAVAEAVQGAGAKLFGQIIHLGRHIDGNYTRTPAWGASPVPWTATAPPPHPMTADEIAEVVAGHADTAVNLLEAGLDGIELQLAHGHLLQQFLSPATNLRDDAYGGSLENRMRFAAETLAAVRRAIGEDATLGIRVSADEFLPGGLTLEMMREIVATLCTRTKVDFVNVSHSAYHGSYTISTQMADMVFDAGQFRSLAPAIRQEVATLPRPPAVFAVCKFRTMAEAETVLAAGDTDMVGMARAHIAEPAIVAKSIAGREAEIRPCIGCNQGCAGFLAQNLAITCLVNPRVGLEDDWPEAVSVPAAEKRRLLVIGGGPGGMEAALTAAARGHEVTLWEAGARLGGTLALVDAMPLRHDALNLLSFQQHSLERLGVEVVLNRRATVDDVLDDAPDAVVVATGAEPAAMPLEAGEAMTLEAALAAPDSLGHRVLLVDNLGTWSVLSAAEWLADRGHAVILLAPTGTPGWTIPIYSSFALRRRLKQKRVRIMGLHTVSAFENGTATLVDLSSDSRQEIVDVGSVIAPVHGRPRSGLIQDLRRAAAERSIDTTFHAVGDAQAARTALEAVFEGQQSGRLV